MYRNKYTPKRNKLTGKYKSTEGKTKKMLDKEKDLGVKFEQDYREYYKEGDMSQREFAKRWGVSRTLIFDTSLGKNGRTSWIQRVGLKK